MARTCVLLGGVASVWEGIGGGEGGKKRGGLGGTYEGERDDGLETSGHFGEWERHFAGGLWVLEAGVVCPVLIPFALDLSSIDS